LVTLDLNGEGCVPSQEWVLDVYNTTITTGTLDINTVGATANPTSAFLPGATSFTPTFGTICSKLPTTTTGSTSSDASIVVEWMHLIGLLATFLL
jgi:hypothetical protein